jgi:hypothetical protein
MNVNKGRWAKQRSFAGKRAMSNEINALKRFETNEGDLPDHFLVSC